MIFRTFYSRFSADRPRFSSRSGSAMKTLYHLKYDSRGVQFLDVSGVSNLYDEIQSHRDSTDLSRILANLDPLQVNNMVSTYSFDDLLNSEIIDATSLPKNAGDMLNLVNKGNELFSGLPIEIREAFNFSPEKFVSSFGTREFADKINFLNASINNDSTPIYDVAKNGKIKKHVNTLDSTKEVSTNESEQ